MPETVGGHGVSIPCVILPGDWYGKPWADGERGSWQVEQSRAYGVTPEHESALRESRGQDLTRQADGFRATSSVKLISDASKLLHATARKRLEGIFSEDMALAHLHDLAEPYGQKRRSPADRAFGLARVSPRASGGVVSLSDFQQYYAAGKLRFGSDIRQGHLLRSGGAEKPESSG